MDESGIDLRQLVAELAASPDAFWWGVLALGLVIGVAPVSASAYARFREGRTRPARSPAEGS